MNSGCLGHAMSAALAWDHSALLHKDIPSRSHVQVGTVDSKMLEYGPGTIYAGFPFSLGFGVGRQSYCNLLASSVIVIACTPPMRFLSALYSLSVMGALWETVDLQATLHQINMEARRGPFTENSSLVEGSCSLPCYLEECTHL